ncbi:hypothetical protein D3C72_1850850 [compost metagenome]
MELHGSVARFIFHPLRHAEAGKPRRLHDVRDDSCCGYQGEGATNEPSPWREEKVQINEQFVSEYYKRE